MSVADLVAVSDFGVWVPADGRTFVVSEQHETAYHAAYVENRTADRIRVVFTISLTGMWEQAVDCDLELLGEVFLISIGGRNPTRIATFVQVMCSPHNRYLRLNEANTLRRVVYEYESVVSDYNPDTIYDATFNKVCDDDGGVRYYLFTGVTH